MSDLNTPNTFTAATNIVAADMNENFDAIETIVNVTGVPEVQTGGVDATDDLVDSIVTLQKLHARTPGRLAGHSQVTSDHAGSGTVASITVTGDGVTPMWLEGYCYACTSSGAIDTEVRLDLLDGSTVLQSSREQMHTPDAKVHLAPRVRVAAWSGSKTFNLNVENSNGTPTACALGTAPAFIRGTWTE